MNKVQATKSSRDLLHTIKDMPKWFWPVIAVILFLIKINVVAHGEPMSVLTLMVSTPSISGAALSTLMASSSIVAGVLAYYWIIHYMENLREGDPIKLALFFSLIGLALGAVFLPLALFLFFAYFFIYATVSSLFIHYAWPYIKRYLLRSKKPVRLLPSNRTTRGEIIVTVILVVPIAALFLLNDRPWLPAEKIAISESNNVVGYVVGVDDVSMAVMDHENRKIIHVPNSTIVSREICNLDKQTSRSLVLSVLKKESPYNQCL